MIIQSRLSKDESQSNSEWTGAVIGAVPGGLLGGIVGGVVLRKKFVINGREDKFRKLVRVISH